MAWGPQARGLYWTPISKNEDGIPQYVRARRTVFTLLLIQLEPDNQINQKLSLADSRHKMLVKHFINIYPPRIAQYRGGSC